MKAGTSHAPWEPFDAITSYEFRVMSGGTVPRSRPVPSLPLLIFVIFVIFATFHNADPAAGCPAPGTKQREHPDAAIIASR